MKLKLLVASAIVFFGCQKPATVLVVDQTPTPTLAPTVNSDLAEVIGIIEANKVKKLKYKARPVLSSKDTKYLKGKSKGIKPETTPQQFAAAPISMDLRPFDTIVKDQGQEGLCTSFAVVGAIEMNAKIQGKAFDLSERHLWSMYQQYYTVSALNASTKNFVTTEMVWPYALSKARSSILPIAKNTTYKELTAWADLWAALSVKKAVVLSADTNTSWSNPYKGVLSTTGTKQGGHAIKVSGYFDTTKGRYLIIKNSWGPSYGDKGYVYLPQAYCSKFYCAFHLISGTQLK